MHVRKSTCVPLVADTHAMSQYEKKKTKNEKKNDCSTSLDCNRATTAFAVTCISDFWLLLFPHRLLQLSYMVQQLGLRLLYVGCKWNIFTPPSILALKLLVPSPSSSSLLIYAYTFCIHCYTNDIYYQYAMNIAVSYVISSNIYGMLFSQASVIAGNRGIIVAEGFGSKIKISPKARRKCVFTQQAALKFSQPPAKSDQKRKLKLRSKEASWQTSSQ